MDLQLCVCRCGVSWSPQLFDFFLVERQLDLSSVTARLRVEVPVPRVSNGFVVVRRVPVYSGIDVELCFVEVVSCVSYPLRDFGPFAGGGSGYAALMGINTPVRHMSSSPRQPPTVGRRRRGRGRWRELRAE
ncbi:hypothetical protein Taro_023217 [Colocasia esculenta]|uniref:Uncharacterized protein n=1 Tax=Colocasia esculenta TaxID=4460 RepID=A0A843V3A8_COLES|nr:hypothetical protein [Colocasia esculenta]